MLGKREGREAGKVFFVSTVLPTKNASGGKNCVVNELTLHSPFKQH